MSGSRNIHWRGEVTSPEEAWHTDAMMRKMHGQQMGPLSLKREDRR